MVRFVFVAALIFCLTQGLHAADSQRQTLIVCVDRYDLPEGAELPAEGVPEQAQKLAAIQAIVELSDAYAAAQTNGAERTTITGSVKPAGDRQGAKYRVRLAYKRESPNAVSAVTTVMELELNKPFRFAGLVGGDEFLVVTLKPAPRSTG